MHTRPKKDLMRRNRVFLLSSSFVFLALALMFSSMKSGCFVSGASDLKVTVHFIDVGQGDSILINASGVEVLVDGGPSSAGNTVLSYLNELSVTHLSLMVATHMHEDHIGGLITVLSSAIQVDEVIINNESDTTQTYTQFITLAQNHGLGVAWRGQVYSLASTVNMTVFNPIQPLEFTDQNENSVVMKLQAGQTSFLLEGDASSGAEQSMINAGLNLHSDVLKVGHHGSVYATTDAFLNSVQPTYAVISCGLNNPYGHPAPETIQRLLSHNVIVYGTYKSGIIIATTDGTTIAFPSNPIAIPEYPTILMPSMLVLTALSTAILYGRKTRSNIRSRHDCINKEQIV
jgi:competence protein ComEC